MDERPISEKNWLDVCVTSLLYRIPKQKFPCTCAVSIQCKNAKIYLVDNFLFEAQQCCATY